LFRKYGIIADTILNCMHALSVYRGRQTLIWTDKVFHIYYLQNYL